MSTRLMRRSRSRGGQHGYQGWLVFREPNYLRDNVSQPNVLFVDGPYGGTTDTVNFLEQCLDRRAHDGHVHRYAPNGRIRRRRGRELHEFVWEGQLADR